MDKYDRERRAFLSAMGGLGMSQMLGSGGDGQTVAQSRGVLGIEEGEHLVHFRDHGNVFIKVSSATGSSNFALGTQQVIAGSGIPTHRHWKMYEAFYVLEGSGTVTLNDVRHPFKQGSSIFIPKNSWHSFENPEHEVLLLWVVTPAGLDGFFRETCNPPGMRSKQLTREQIREIAKRYDTEFR